MESFAGVKIGVANRGIPAIRIGRTIREMGGVYVAFYSREDKAAPHVSKADQAYPARWMRTLLTRGRCLLCQRWEEQVFDLVNLTKGRA